MASDHGLSQPLKAAYLASHWSWPPGPVASRAATYRRQAGDTSWASRPMQANKDDSGHRARARTLTRFLNPCPWHKQQLMVSCNRTLKGMSHEHRSFSVAIESILALTCMTDRLFDGYPMIYHSKRQSVTTREYGELSSGLQRTRRAPELSRVINRAVPLRRCA